MCPVELGSTSSYLLDLNPLSACYPVQCFFGFAGFMPFNICVGLAVHPSVFPCFLLSSRRVLSCSLSLSPWHSVSGFKAAFHKARNCAAHAKPQFHSIRPRQRIKSGGARAFRVHTHTQIHSQTREGVVTYPYPCAETQQTTLHYWIYKHTIHAINDCLLLLRCLFFFSLVYAPTTFCFGLKLQCSFRRSHSLNFVRKVVQRRQRCAAINVQKSVRDLCGKIRPYRNHRHRVLSSRRHSLNIQVHETNIHTNKTATCLSKIGWQI